MQRFVSNRMEVLAANLAVHLMEDPPDPMEPEIVVVQSRGMERWLSMEMAKWAGIASHVCFLFPASLMTRLLRPLQPLAAEEDPWKPDSLRWTCFEALAALPDDPDTEPVARYTGGDALRRFQLADLLADLFDQYLMFRPDRILAWEEGAETHFQARLWRMLRSRIDAPHRVDLLRNGATGLKARALPARISIFGVSALPPLYLDFLEQLSENVDIRWYLLDPCQEYWGEVRCEDFWEKSALKAEEAGLGAAALHAERGHGLLASLGRTGQDFFRRLAEMRGEERRHVLEPGMDSLLHRLQSRILSLEVLPAAPLSEEALERDDSIAIHRCHGPMREMEVLRDQILRLFSEENPPRPRDILVMFPDVAAYAPYIDAVFSRPLADGRRLPYMISERPMVMENRLAGLLMRGMRLMDSRFGASEVFDLLEAVPVRKKLGLDAEGLERIRSWLVDTRVRWGLDAAFREALDLPALAAHTWRFGLDRMVLGMAMEDEGGLPEKGGVLPYDPMGPEAADTLNSLLAFMDTLTSFHRDMREERAPREWMDRIWSFAQDLFHEDAENTEEFLGLRGLLDAFVEETRLAGLGERLSFPLVRSVLGQQLERPGKAGLMLGAGVTFCAMVPMRCIPFSVVCLCGMNDGAFPRMRPRPAFDILQQHPRPGDRSSRDDDRYLFLETLLSARDKLWITCTGFRPEDDQPLPPSVLVQELLDTILKDEGSLPAAVMQRHPLHPFSPGLFAATTPVPGRPFTFHAGFRDIAGAFCERRETEALSFQDEALQAEALEDTVFFDDLIRFYEDPSAFFLKRVLGMSLEREETALEDREAFAADGLDAFLIREAFCRAFLEERDTETTRLRLEAGGILPAGAPDRFRTMALEAEARALAVLVRKAPGETGGAPTPFVLSVGELRLEGSLPRVEGEGEKWWRPGSLRPKDLLTGWLRFLVRRSLGMEKDLHLLGMGKQGGEIRTFAAALLSAEKALSRLLVLTRLYRSAYSRPVAFFPSISKAWVDTLMKKKTPWERDEALWKLWEGDAYRVYRQSSPADLLLWRGRNPFEEPFVQIAEAVWLPVLEILKENRS